MAEETEKDNEIFRHSTMNRIASADELDHYIKVTNPSAWIVAVAALLLVVGVIIWAVLAIVPVTVNTTGVTLESDKTGTTVVCWVDKSTAEKIEKLGGKANIDGVEATSLRVDPTPMSSSEVIALLGSEFYVESLHLSDWNYLVIITPSEEPNYTDFVLKTSVGDSHLVPVSIVVSETRPINIVMGNE